MTNAQRQAAEDRHMIREWQAIVSRLNAIMHGADNGRAGIRCRDGTALTLLFDVESANEGKDVTSLGVRMDRGPEADALRLRWDYARNPARGLFYDVSTADVLELVWLHGGVDMDASREATRLEQEGRGNG